MWSIDCETKDPDLLTKGAGVRRHDSHIVGISICHSSDMKGTYLPLFHSEGGNVSRSRVAEVLTKIAHCGEPITGANLLYDFDWIMQEFGIWFKNPWCDIQIIEPLIDENAKSYSLNALAQKYLGETKDELALYQYAAARFGGKPDRKQAANIWRCPSHIVAPYAISDAELPIRIYREQMKEVERQKLERIVDLETRLQPMLLRMKRQGVRIDGDAVLDLRVKLLDQESQLVDDLARLNGNKEVRIWAAADLAELFDRHKQSYPKTEKGTPSFTAGFLKGCGWDGATKIAKLRHLEKLRSTFIDKAILGNLVGDRIHCQFNQLRGDEYGTVTGRMSSSLPNLQQIPARTEAGRLIRTLFIPENDEDWYKLDYSQIEPRLLLSYAKDMQGAERVIEAYHNDPALDCYQGMMNDMPEWMNRADVKAVFLGASYGMGKALMAENMGVTMEEAEIRFNAFHDGAPYIKELSSTCMSRAERVGEIRTIGGRVRRFSLWEPRGARDVALPKEEAQEAYGAVKRAFTYKALNSLIQGGAADIMKAAMVMGYEQGLPLPTLTVHDELDMSLPSREGAEEWQRVMQEAYRSRLTVPMRVDVEVGPNWGSVK